MKIKSIKFKNDKTLIKFFSSEQPRGYNEVIEETVDKKTDQIRHKDFQAALDKIAPHILIRGEFTNIMDRLDRPIDMKWFSDFSHEDDPRFDGIEITGVIIQGKDATDGVQLVGRKVMEDGGVIELKTPSIGLFNDGSDYYYPLADILSSQIETLLTEAESFVNGKTGATKQMEIEFKEPKKLKAAS